MAPAEAARAGHVLPGGGQVVPIRETAALRQPGRTPASKAGSPVRPGSSGAIGPAGPQRPHRELWGRRPHRRRRLGRPEGSGEAV